ncbi:MAG: thrombospondin type 3 repeat-containing protein [Planctomycetes bacterium]|nr:thrombospondin type 3 repeat-containing protein [Planctomycetota bacterium]
MRVGHHLLSIITFAIYFTLAASALMAGDQPEAGYRLQLREPSAQYRLVEPRPRVLSRGRNATVTSLSAHQQQVLSAMNQRAGDGGGADVGSLQAIQFYYAESSCTDADSQLYKEDCGGEPCNVVGLRWEESIPANSEGVLLFVDDEQFGDPVAGILPDILETGNNINGLNLTGLEPGEHFIRIEELNNGTLEELSLIVFDAPPFPDETHDLSSIQCGQAEINGSCGLAVTFGANIGADNYLVYLNGELMNQDINDTILPPGIIFGGLNSGQEYCVSLQPEWRSPEAVGNVLYLGCVQQGSCCTINCEADQCNPVAGLEICQTGYSEEDGLAEVEIIWRNMEATYGGGINLRIDEDILGSGPVTFPFDPATGQNPNRVMLSGVPDMEIDIGIQGLCTTPLEASAFNELAVNVMPSSPYTDPVEGDAVCSYDPTGNGATTARWTNTGFYKSLDVYVLPAGELNPVYADTIKGVQVSEATIRGTTPGDRLVLQFFRNMEGGCYGSEKILCIQSTDSDQDGILDNMDNCPVVSNAGQEDSDGDGVGDECDNCINGANPDQADENGNGIGDACETAGPIYFVRSVCRNGNTNPQLSDAVYLLNFLFTGGEMPQCQAACDTDGDNRIGLTDSVQVLQFLFLGGVPPVTWDGPNPVCETFERGIPSFGLGCEESNGSCSRPGRVN